LKYVYVVGHGLTLLEGSLNLSILAELRRRRRSASSNEFVNVGTRGRSVAVDITAQEVDTPPIHSVLNERRAVR